MSVATGTAIAIGVGAMSAGASVASAKMSSNAAKNAAKIQTASQDKAQGFNQQVYADQRAALNPYVQAGNDSLSRLMQQHWGSGGLSPGMMGTAAPQGQFITPGSGYQPPAPGSVAPGMGGSPLNQAMGQRPNPGGPPQGQAVPRQPQGGLVMMEGPDGTRKQVPQANVQAAMQLGAHVVQG